MSCVLVSGAAVRPILLRNSGAPRIGGVVSRGFCTKQQLHQRHVSKIGAEQKREYTVFGDVEDEESEPPKVPGPDEKDFWEGEKWEWLGKLSFVIVPALVLLAILTGAFAAKTYDSGATSYLAPPSPDDATVKIIPGKSEQP